MEKKLIFLIFLAIIPFMIVSSIPQFLIFQGEARLDGRLVPNNTLINFSINNTEIVNTTTNSIGEYGPILVQGFSDYYEEQFNITIDGYETEQEIYYTYPQDIFLNLSALTKDALKITDSFPAKDEITIQKTRTQTFNISTSTGYSDIVNHSWFLDGEKTEFSDVNFSSFNYTIENDDEGEHNITVIVSDGFLTRSKEWNLIIERPEISNFDGDTTDFDSFGLDELENVSDVILEKTGKGRIEFLQDLNLSGVIDLNNKVRIESGVVAIDTSFYPQLDKPARITLTGLSYDTIPKIFYNSGFTTNPSEINKECDFCNLISYTPYPTTNGTVVFEVEHFSSFKPSESGDKYNLTLFDELDTCKSGMIGDFVLNIKEPDEGDEFKPDEEIEIKVEVENNADEDKDVVVEVALYNIDEDDIEEEVDEKEEIRDGRDETFEFIFDVPDDFEDDDYVIYVKAYEDDEEGSQCVEGAIGIDFEREKHDVIIKDFSIAPESVAAGKSFDVFLEVQNVGESDEDVYMVVEIEELNVLTESESFELEEFGEDDTYSQIISVKTPADAEEGEYEVKIKAIFDGEETEETAKIIVSEKVPVTKTTIYLTKKEPEKAPEIQKPQKVSEISLLIPIGFAIGIIILIILIIIVRKKRIS